MRHGQLHAVRQNRRERLARQKVFRKYFVQPVDLLLQLLDTGVAVGNRLYIECRLLPLLQLLDFGLQSCYLSRRLRRRCSQPVQTVDLTAQFCNLSVETGNLRRVERFLLLGFERLYLLVQLGDAFLCPRRSTVRRTTQSIDCPGCIFHGRGQRQRERLGEVPHLGFGLRNQIARLGHLLAQFTDIATHPVDLPHTYVIHTDLVPVTRLWLKHLLYAAGLLRKGIAAGHDVVEVVDKATLQLLRRLFPLVETLVLIVPTELEVAARQPRPDIGKIGIEFRLLLRLSDSRFGLPLDSSCHLILLPRKGDTQHQLLVIFRRPFPERFKFEGLGTQSLDDLGLHAFELFEGCLALLLRGIGRGEFAHESIDLPGLFDDLVGQFAILLGGILGTVAERDEEADARSDERQQQADGISGNGSRQRVDTCLDQPDRCNEHGESGFKQRQRLRQRTQQHTQRPYGRSNGSD